MKQRLRYCSIQYSSASLVRFIKRLKLVLLPAPIALPPAGAAHNCDLHDALFRYFGDYPGASYHQRRAPSVRLLACTRTTTHHRAVSPPAHINDHIVPMPVAICESARIQFSFTARCELPAADTALMRVLCAFTATRAVLRLSAPGPAQHNERRQCKNGSTLDQQTGGRL